MDLQKYIELLLGGVIGFAFAAILQKISKHIDSNIQKKSLRENIENEIYDILLSFERSNKDAHEYDILRDVLLSRSIPKNLSIIMKPLVYEYNTPILDALIFSGQIFTYIKEQHVYNKIIKIHTEIKEINRYQHLFQKAWFDAELCNEGISEAAYFVFIGKYLEIIDMRSNLLADIKRKIPIFKGKGEK